MKAKELREEINRTLIRENMTCERTLKACEVLLKRLSEGCYDAKLEKIRDFLPFTGNGKVYISDEISNLINSDILRERLKKELPPGREPLGVLLHIGAGNVPGLGAYSVIEGLLAGNINILKPASVDAPISGFILRELVKAEPELKPYIYMFEIPSTHASAVPKLKELISLSDAVSVWGGDRTIKAVRELAGADKKLIEWGHKFSFVYISRAGLKDRAAIKDLAKHIQDTGMRLCSSCQTVYVEGGSKEDMRLLREELNASLKQGSDIKDAAETLRRYTEKLMSELPAGSGEEERYDFLGCPLISADRGDMPERLRADFHSLQTVGLICAGDEEEELSRLFIRAGATRIRRPSEMSAYIPGEAHDGKFPLYEYTKRAEYL